jgi:hypothetical protein
MGAQLILMYHTAWHISQGALYKIGQGPLKIKSWLVGAVEERSWHIVSILY